ncbi:MAG: methyltransferase [Pseudomonadota bacterium]
MTSRLATALADGLITAPTGRIAVFRPPAEADLTPLDSADVHVIHGFKPASDAWLARGYAVDVAPSEHYQSALVYVPRAKALAQALIADAIRVTGGGPVIVDGLKQDGVESLYKACRKRGEVSAAVSKAHGKTFVIHAGAFDDWTADTHATQGYRTAPGVFSADHVDDASAALADALPAKLPPAIADLGAGWGYLAAQALTRPGVDSLHLVEAEHAALACARHNVTDGRAVFHWADALSFEPPERLDAVITNPPFHQTRAAEPELGRRFIRAAAAMLKPSGRLWLVANRHLPYEMEARAHFREVHEIGGTARFKILAASKPAAAPLAMARPGR